VGLAPRARTSPTTSTTRGGPTRHRPAASSRPRLSRHESRECSEPRFPFTGVPHRVPHTAHAARATPGTPTGRHDDILAISIRPAYIRLHKHAARAEAGRWLAPAQCALVTYGFTSAGATGVLHSQAIGCRCLESESTCCSGPEVKNCAWKGMRSAEATTLCWRGSTFGLCRVFVVWRRGKLHK
jgi:hypothetical protein